MVFGWSKKTPYPPRSEVLPLPEMSHAKPTRGATFRNVTGNPSAGTSASPANTTPRGELEYRCDCSPGCHAATRLLRSVYGKKGSHRIPRFSTNRGRTLQESCTNIDTRWKRVLRYSPAPCVKSLNFPT